MREVSNAAWDDIQDRLKEQAAEIERLRNEIVVLQRNELYLEELADRAADALAGATRFQRIKLITELRQATQTAQ
jgi:hypothetical protein